MLSSENKSASKKRLKASARWTKANSSIMTAVERSLSQLQDQFAQLLEMQKAVMGSHGPSQLLDTSGPQPPLIAMKASIPWTPDLGIDSSTKHPVPGDGACLWHALLACSLSEAASPSSPELGHQFKQDVLARLQQRAHVYAQAWGGTVEGVLSTLCEWQDNWADACAIVAASLEHSAMILVCNQKDSAIEAMVVGHQPWSQPTWVVLFSGDHYEPMARLSPQQLVAIQQRLQFTPWKVPVRHNQGGGLSLPSVSRTWGGRGG